VSLLDDLIRKRAKLDAAIQDLKTLDDPPGGLVTAFQKLVNEGTAVDWLIGGLMVKGSVNMLVADPKVGKTTLVVQLALAITSGSYGIFGFNISECLPVLVVEAEGARRAFAARLATTARSMNVEIPTNGFIQADGMTDFQIGSPGLERLIAASKAGLVVLDTLGYFHTGDENSATDWKKNVMVPLRKLTAKYGCSFLLVHHQTKESQERKGWQKGRGTAAMFGDCDLWLRMEAPDGTAKRVLHVDGNKYGRMGYEIPLSLDTVRAIFTWD